MMKRGKKSEGHKVVEREGNVVQFPNTKEYHDFCINEDDIKNLVEDYKYFEKKDWEGLIKHREQMCGQTPDNPYVERSLGEAYFIKGDYERALQYFAVLYKKHPDFENIQSSILDTLYALGKNENDFDWLEKPKIISLTSEIIDKCYDLLEPEKKPWRIFNVFEEIFPYGDYPKFNMKDLLEALKKDQRFVITDGIYEEEVSVRKK